MTHPEARRWDEKYQRDQDLWLERKPRQLLTTHAHLLPESGYGLDAASGVSINGQFLAEHGLRVLAVDISEIALRLAKQRAQKEGFSLEAVVLDLSNPWLPKDYFDVILNFFFLERATIPVYRQALVPGGLIFFETYFNLSEIEEKKIFYLNPGELFEYFQDFQIIYNSEEIKPPGDTHPERGLAQLLARKPKPKTVMSVT
jgi:SAM-dependent methyltransferase